MEGTKRLTLCGYLKNLSDLPDDHMKLTAVSFIIEKTTISICGKCTEKLLSIFPDKEQYLHEKLYGVARSSVGCNH